MNQNLQEVYNSILNGSGKLMKDGIQTTLNVDVSDSFILNQSIIAVMAEGECLLERAETCVPKILITAGADL